MNVYLVKTNGYNMIVFTNGKTAKCFTGDADGMFDGIDIYSKDAARKFQRHYEMLGLNDYNEIYGEAIPWSMIEDYEGNEIILLYVKESKNA